MFTSSYICSFAFQTEGLFTGRSWKYSLFNNKNWEYVFLLVGVVNMVCLLVETMDIFLLVKTRSIICLLVEIQFVY